jgi:hypothetical protein
MGKTKGKKRRINPPLDVSSDDNMSTQDNLADTDEASLEFSGKSIASDSNRGRYVDGTFIASVDSVTALIQELHDYRRVSADTKHKILDALAVFRRILASGVTSSAPVSAQPTQQSGFDYGRMEKFLANMFAATFGQQPPTVSSTAASSSSVLPTGAASPAPRYASVARASPASRPGVSSNSRSMSANPSKKPATKTVLVTSKETNTAVNIEAELKRGIHPTRDNLHLHIVAKLPSGDVVLGLPDDAHTETVLTTITTKCPTLSAAKNDRHPKIAIHDVPLDITQHEIETALTAVAGESPVKVMLTKPKVGSRPAPGKQSGTTNSPAKAQSSASVSAAPTSRRVYAIVHPKTFGLLKTDKRLLLPWKSCRVTESLSPRRCARCFAFGHFADKCPVSKDGITSITQLTASNHCANCQARKLVHDTHSTTSSACPLYQRLLANVRSRTVYTYDEDA